MIVTTVNKHTNNQNPKTPRLSPGFSFPEFRSGARAVPSGSPSTGSDERSSVRGWRDTVGNIELVQLKKTYHRLQVTGTCVNNQGVRFHRIRDLKQYYFNSNYIPPTSRHLAPRRDASRAWSRTWPRAWTSKLYDYDCYYYLYCYCCYLINCMVSVTSIIFYKNNYC